MKRLNRKDEHLWLSTRRMPTRAVFSDITFINNCLPDLNFNAVSLQTKFLGRTMRSPFCINALTGGTKKAFVINTALAKIAREFEMPMAVGSQKMALDDKRAENSFKVVRKINPNGLIYANIGSYASPEMAKRAVKMIKADALQVHLNVPQELWMEEGDCNFEGMVRRIQQIVKASDVPVIAKEVGFGVAKEQAEQLKEAGIAGIDIGGRGGTNFIDIELKRSGRKIDADLKKWGIPTAISLAEVKMASGKSLDIAASGGLYNATDIAKALAMGASICGMAAYPVYILQNKGYDYLLNYYKRLITELKKIMMMTGAKSIKELQAVPLVVSGYTAEWMQRRGLDPNYYASKR